MKLLTIAVPSYNVEKYLNRCMRTLTSSLYLDKLEIIIVNDGSIDNTFKIAEKYANAYPQSVLVITKENGGHGSALNSALDAATGKYFMVVDGDDWVDTSSLNQLIKKLSSVDADLISTNYNRVDMESGESTNICQRDVLYEKLYLFEDLNPKTVYFALASTCFKTEILTAHNIRMQENTFYVDVEYILMPIPFVETIYFIDIYLYKYFVGNSEQSIYIPTLVKRYLHHERVLKRVICYLQEYHLSGVKALYVQNILQQLLYTHYSISLIYNSDQKIGYNQAKLFDKFLKIQSPELYIIAGKTIPVLRLARSYNYDCERINNSIIFKIKKNSRLYRLVKKIYNKIVRIFR